MIMNRRLEEPDAHESISKPPTVSILTDESLNGEKKQMLNIGCFLY
jgi:hypothetical protein